jgi:hypothetical protein
MIEKFVNNQIKIHQGKYYINFSDMIISIIVDHVKSGVYAFQIIYDEEYTTDLNDYKEAILVKPLDWNKVIKNSYHFTHFGQSLWSYDGGTQFKYSQTETLKLDVGLIRELKLNGILSK